jgi:hypothetical protein
MAWRAALAKSLGRDVGPETTPPTLIDNIDEIDKTPTAPNSVNSVNFVHSPSTLEMRDAQAASPTAGLSPIGGPVPLLAPAQCREITGWPVETQRFFVASLDAFEAQGHPLPQAYGTIKESM